MREVCCRSYYCPKLGRTVRIMEHRRNECGRDPVCGILSCSHQDVCAAAEEKEKGKPVHPWAGCPACKELEEK
ncbi:MAG: hypothetical protein ACLFOY_13835 [Desulfatibacillaceae bacterium]